MGNQYFLEYEGQGKKGRRSVEYAPNSTRDSKALPTEWWSWLHYSRDSIPTEEELLASERARRNLKARVEEIENLDRTQRLQQQLVEHDAANDPASTRQAPRDPSSLHLLVKQSAEHDGIDTHSAKPDGTGAQNTAAHDSARFANSTQTPQAPSTAGQDSSYQPEGWQPTSRARRR